jgi:glycosyltransferase involved in cell wall biosynthesis
VCYEGGALPNLRKSGLARVGLPFLLVCQFLWIGLLMLLWRPVLVHSHWIVPQGFFAVLWGLVSRAPVLLTAHAGDVFALQMKALRLLGRYTLRRGAVCTVNSRATDAAVHRIFETGRTEVIPMGVDLEDFDPEHRSEDLRFNLNIAGPMILTVGRFAEKKGLAYLIEAMPRVLETHSGARLVMVGFGPLERELRTKVKELGIKEAVHFAGRLSHDELPVYYASADVFVLPSVVDQSGDTEGLGVVMLEAMASGTPVVASEVGGIPDVVQDGETGLLVPPREPQAIAEAICRLVEDAPLRSRLVEAARESVRRTFSWELLCGRFAALYDEITEDET